MEARKKGSIIVVHVMKVLESNYIYTINVRFDVRTQTNERT